MMRCKEVSRAVAGDEFRNAGWLRRFSLRIHLAMCRHCRRYSRQIDLIGAEARELSSATDADESAVKRIEQSLRSDGKMR